MISEPKNHLQRTSLLASRQAKESLAKVRTSSNKDLNFAQVGKGGLPPLA